MSTKSMTKGMAGKTLFPPQSIFMGMDMTRKIEGVNWFITIFILFWEKPVFWFIKRKPVLSKDIKCISRKNSISIRAIFPMSDMDFHSFAINIFIFLIANLTNSKT